MTPPNTPDRSDGAAEAGSDVPPNVTVEVDATGLACPLPVIELSKAIEGVAAGEVVLLSATDPASNVDVPVWCRMQRQRLVAREQTGSVLRFWVERIR